MTTVPWDRWLIKDYSCRGVRKLLETVEEVVAGKPVVRIAHIEDNLTDAMLIRYALRQREWRVTAFCSYDEAAESLVGGDLSSFDCVLSDIMLPVGWEGLILAAGIKERRPELPVIMYTNRAEPDRPTAQQILDSAA